VTSTFAITMIHTMLKTRSRCLSASPPRHDAQADERDQQDPMLSPAGMPKASVGMSPPPSLAPSSHRRDDAFHRAFSRSAREFSRSAPPARTAASPPRLRPRPAAPRSTAEQAGAHDQPPVPERVLDSLRHRAHLRDEGRSTMGVPWIASSSFRNGEQARSSHRERIPSIRTRCRR